MRIEYKENNLFIENDYTITGLGDKAENLFKEQVNNWPQAKQGYKSLESIQKKEFEFENFKITAQFNPGRIVSSSAKVDKKSISERPCFLCVKNLPLEQKAVKAEGNYIILVNPFPIFPVHFTIPSINHIPQSIENEFVNMLMLAKNLGNKFTLFYNGPKCGASAPDHQHFQAGNKNFMRIDSEYDIIKNKHGDILLESKDLKMYSVSGYLRNFISLESSSAELLADSFRNIYKLLSEPGLKEEPMMNIICSYDGEWRVIIFPREKHRPSYYFEEGENQIILSPAAVDFGGVCILPKEEDFQKITKDLLIDVFKQVSIGQDKFKYISGELKDLINN